MKGGSTGRETRRTDEEEKERATATGEETPETEKETETPGTMIEEIETPETV